jgi:hypothetical protein
MGKISGADRERADVTGDSSRPRRSDETIGSGNRHSTTMAATKTPPRRSRRWGSSSRSVPRRPLQLLHRRAIIPRSRMASVLFPTSKSTTGIERTQQEPFWGVWRGVLVQLTTPSSPDCPVRDLRERNRVAKMLLVSSNPTTRFADELRIPDQRLDLLYVEMASAARESTHLFRMVLAAFVFSHRSNSFRSTGIGFVLLVAIAATKMWSRVTLSRLRSLPTLP